MDAREGSWGLAIVALGVLVSLAGCEQSAPPKAAVGADCGAGRLVASDEGDVCVFRRDQPLVIEGGFNCPASFEHRMDTATAIACSARRLELLPPAVCAQIDGPCDASVPRGPDTDGDAGPPTPSETDDELGECVYPCASDGDCGLGQSCENGICVAGGCEDDAWCVARGWPDGYVCRPSASGTRECVSPCETADDCGWGTESPRTTQFGCVDGGCSYIGCTSDEQCNRRGVCGAQAGGPNECMFRCDTVADCARNAQAELGLDGPDPNDPFTTEDAFICRHGLCRVRPSCHQDADCPRWFGSDSMVCQSSSAVAGGFDRFQLEAREAER